MRFWNCIFLIRIRWDLAFFEAVPLVHDVETGRAVSHPLFVFLLPVWLYGCAVSGSVVVGLRFVRLTLNGRHCHGSYYKRHCTGGYQRRYR